MEVDSTRQQADLSRQTVTEARIIKNASNLNMSSAPSEVEDHLSILLLQPPSDVIKVDQSEMMFIDDKVDGNTSLVHEQHISQIENIFKSKLRNNPISKNMPDPGKRSDVLVTLASVVRYNTFDDPDGTSGSDVGSTQVDPVWNSGEVSSGTTDAAVDVDVPLQPSQRHPTSSVLNSASTSVETFTVSDLSISSKYDNYLALFNTTTMSATISDGERRYLNTDARTSVRIYKKARRKTVDSDDVGIEQNSNLLSNISSMTSQPSMTSFVHNNSSLTSKPSECLDLDLDSGHQSHLCSKIASCRRSMSSFTSPRLFSFCDHLAVDDFIDAAAYGGRCGSAADDLTDIDLCLRCVEEAELGDALALEQYKLFEAVLSKFNCDDEYSVAGWNCSSCRVSPLSSILMSDFDTSVLVFVSG